MLPSTSIDRSDYMLPILEVSVIASKEFADEAARRPRRPWAMWAYVEAMALFLHENILSGPKPSLETRRMSRVITLFGEAFLSTIRVLAKKKLLDRNNSPIRPNLNLVLLLFSTFGGKLRTDKNRENGICDWAKEVIRLTGKHGLGAEHIDSMDFNARAYSRVLTAEVRRVAGDSALQIIQTRNKRDPAESPHTNGVEVEKEIDQPVRASFSLTPPEWLSNDQKTEWSFRFRRESLRS